MAYVVLSRPMVTTVFLVFPRKWFFFFTLGAMLVLSILVFLVLKPRCQAARRRHCKSSGCMMALELAWGSSLGGKDCQVVFQQAPRCSSKGQGSCSTKPTKIAQWQSLAISALTEPNRQKSRRKKGFWPQTFAARNRKSLATFALLNRNAALLSLVSEIAAISGVRDGHRNRKSQKSLRFSQIAKIAAISVR